MSDRYQHLFRKSLDAKRGGHTAWFVQSTGERVAVALVLNRADWIPEGIERSGAEWVSIIPQVASQLEDEAA